MSGRRQERLRPYREVRRRYRPDRRAFERLVAEALEALPADFRDKLSNVAVVVAERPSSAEAEAVGRDLLGLYRGIPYGQRGVGYHLVPPDRITIYREPILAACRTPAEVREEVRKTVLHEIGHYFGLSEADLP